MDDQDLKELRERLLPSDQEHCAVLYAAECKLNDGQFRLLVREIEYPTVEDYTVQSIDRAELSPHFVARVSKRARTQNLSLVFTHTHPGVEPPVFSLIDNGGERLLADFLVSRGQHRNHAALVLSEGGLRARRLGAQEELRVIALGAKRKVEFEPLVGASDYSRVFDRQVRAFGAAGQRRLGALRVGIVGLGGTGSVASQQLVHLGIRHFLLIDPDTIEETNLNRVVGATPSDIGAGKVAVASRYIKEFNAAVGVEAITGDVVYDAVAQKLAQVDLILCCTDSHGSRSVVQQVAYQHLIPCIDVGSTIIQRKGEVTGIYGRVQLLAPTLPCLWCSELLDASEVRRDMMNESERRLDPYIVGSREPAPSVISLNGTVVSLAVTMMLGIIAEAPVNATHLIYSGMAPSVRSVRGTRKPDCFICSKNGALAWGHDRPLFTRRD
ncbi:ThiF family adenylyltransferase [Mesorhizobium sp. WSM2561]|uniref:HesA/MoeB/ThiF family protein n=1 Tax=Mesorhizobium sp. WSM2561 TaxID=1040985 RepID=UPI0018DB21BD|nr:ThiF family adenylyltransferase [Mesorhizobium sp. WSM2561]